ncbi:MAG: hypothetical protein OK454_05695, partial [Thaumarchaeota archaeon]|nr:hypothetical protein [Nitrososphaerota archaeon]
ANPTAQLEVALARYWEEVAGSEDETKTSSGAPAAMAAASAVEPPDFTGATGTPVLAENPVRSEVVSLAYASAEYEINGARAIEVDVVVTVVVEMDVDVAVVVLVGPAGPVTVAVVVVIGPVTVAVVVGPVTVAVVVVEDTVMTS